MARRLLKAADGAGGGGGGRRRRQGREDSERGTRDALTSIHRRRIVLQKGDAVRVKQGELQNLLGKVVRRRRGAAAGGR